MVGHAPQELIDFIGYNPVIELSDKISPEEQIADVIEHIEDYQSLVDKIVKRQRNREAGM